MHSHLLWGLGAVVLTLSHTFNPSCSQQALPILKKHKKQTPASHKTSSLHPFLATVSSFFNKLKSPPHHSPSSPPTYFSMHHVSSPRWGYIIVPISCSPFPHSLLYLAPSAFLSLKLPFLGWVLLLFPNSPGGLFIAFNSLELQTTYGQICRLVSGISKHPSNHLWSNPSCA